MKSTIFALAFLSLTLPAFALDGRYSPANVALFEAAPLDLPSDLMAQANPGRTTGVDPLIGTWKLNLEKSRFTGRASPKSRIVTWAGEGQNLAVTIEGVEAKGQPLKLIFRHIYDGQPHPVIGSPDYDSNTYYRIGNSINSTFFKDGKVVGLTQVQLVPGKTVTVIEEGIDAGDLPYHDVLVFERQ
jgi:hypothetical protein